TIAFVANSFIALVIVFAFWGLSSNAVSLPVQHRLVQVDPEMAGVSLSWFSTALYAGIAFAPPLGAFALGLGHPQLIPLLGAAAVILGGTAFLFGHVARRPAALAVSMS
ncbi:MAG: MFS transporter, partial [Leifsonia sp.]